MKTKLLLALFLGTFGLSSFKVDKTKSEGSGTIRLEGAFYAKEGGSLSDISVEIVNLHSNEMEDIVLAKSKAKFELKLGYKYMVYIKKKGYSTKKIMVDAREAKRGSYKFQFDMELHQLNEKHSTNAFRPVCVLTYNRLKQKFVYDSDYTSIAKSDLEQEVLSKK